MKNIYIALLLLLLSSFYNLKAQSFTFEASTVPAEWTSLNGSLSLSKEHYKDGIQSLCWETSGKSVLEFTFPEFSTGSNSAYMQIYSPTVTEDTLKVEFINAGTTKRTANYILNYKGWREFHRAYTEYSATLSTPITSVKITLLPASTGSRKIYFDKINLNATTNSKKIPGSMWVYDKEYMNLNSLTVEPLTLYDNYRNKVDVPLTTPTDQELYSLAKIRGIFKKSPVAGSSSDVSAAKNYVASLNIVRNPDGSVRGKIIDTSVTGLTDNNMADIFEKLEVLAADALVNDATKPIFNDFLDHILDQGIGEGCCYQTKPQVYAPIRKDVCPRILNLLPACTNEQKTEVLKLSKWLSFYGKLYDSPDTYLTRLNSDILYNYLPLIFGIALASSDDAVAVREMKCVKRFLERNTEYVPGDLDILKVDGTGFHHNSHYNNYMYAYQPWIDHIYNLKGTSFKISPDSYQRLKKAIISLYTMATTSTDDYKQTALSLSGRIPFGVSQRRINFTKTQFDKLIQIGADCMNIPVDEELAAAYNFFFKTTKYNVPEKKYEGFFQFNYSPLGIYRRNNWVVTMRSPSKILWGAEIYSAQNVLGRYHCHGSLEVNYSGPTLAYSGYPTNSTGGGWDWNVVPGATTVHYTSWKEMMAYQTNSSSPWREFNQFTKTKDYSGALAWDDCGMYSCDFDQLDTWRSTYQAFKPTNLTFKKSMFAFDDMVLSIGSDISSSGSYDNSMITATNLFQCIISSVVGNLTINGNAITYPHTTSLDNSVDNWILSPTGTGFIIPKNNDVVDVKYISQTTPKSNGSDYASPTTTSKAAKAYFNHGIKPTNKNYSFILIPGTNQTKMQALMTQYQNNSEAFFKIHSHTNILHSVTYTPKGITAYSAFQPLDNLAYGIFNSTDSPLMLMEKLDSTSTSKTLSVAACNPNLNPKPTALYHWVSAPKTTTITLDGEWTEINSSPKVEFLSPYENKTQVKLTFQDGESLYFLAQSVSTGIMSGKEDAWFTYYKQDQNLVINLSSYDPNGVLITLTSLDGRTVNQIRSNDNSIIIDVSKYQKGILICTVSTSQKTKMFKFLNN